MQVEISELDYKHFIDAFELLIQNFVQLGYSPGELLEVVRKYDYFVKMHEAVVNKKKEEEQLTTKRRALNS